MAQPHPRKSIRWPRPATVCPACAGRLPRIGTYGIDYLIGEEDCIGKGLGKDMMKLLVNRIFSFPDAYRITADIDRENHASEKTLLSCGFTLQNPVKSRYILLKSEFIKTS